MREIQEQANQNYNTAISLIEANAPTSREKAKILCCLMTAAVRNHALALNQLLNCLAQPSYNQIFLESPEIQRIFLFEFFNCLYHTSYENQAQLWPKLLIPQEDLSFASESVAQRCYQMGCYLVDESCLPNQNFLYPAGMNALYHAFNSGYMEAGIEIRQQNEARRPALAESHAQFFANLGNAANSFAAVPQNRH